MQRMLIKFFLSYLLKSLQYLIFLLKLSFWNCLYDHGFKCIHIYYSFKDVKFLSLAQKSIYNEDFGIISNFVFCHFISWRLYFRPVLLYAIVYVQISSCLLRIPIIAFFTIEFPFNFPDKPHSIKPKLHVAEAFCVFHSLVCFSHCVKRNPWLIYLILSWGPGSL